MRSLALASALSAILLTGAAATPGHAESRPDGWQTWTWSGSCFAVLFPSGPQFPQSKIGKAYASVRHAPAENSFDGIAFISGETNAGNMEAKVDIDGQEFELLVYGDAGFVSTGPRETRLLEAIEKGHEMKVIWSRQDSMEVHTYALGGFANAKRTIDQACNYQKPAVAATKR